MHTGKHLRHALRALLILGLLVVALQTVVTATPLAEPPQSAVERPAAQPPAPPAPPTNQMIVRYEASQLRANSISPDSVLIMQRLSAAAGIELTYGRAISGDAHVLRLPQRLALADVQVMADRLNTLPEVAYAEPDAVMTHMLTPNDPQYGNQWHYFAPGPGNYGINAPAAWDITTGSASVVVAVIDTGITNHPDLNGRTVQGYDFIHDSRDGNDGDGRDGDPSDPGDWITPAESASGYFQGCVVTNSSWHGTHTGGTIGAASNNGVGVAGVDWNAKILPVRVLGKCGGYTSDIVDGMRWAAGLAVSGVPNNANPAKVLNMSLGGQSACTSGSAYQLAVNDVVGAGSTVVVSAGNSNANASGFSPAGCNGVITVAATNRNGSRASYSNYGSVVEISAPGGETQPTSSNGVLSTLNTGTQGPGSPTYTYYQGTSMAAPHVAGVISLMLSRNPALSPSQVLSILRSTVTLFPGGSSCNTSNCGSGIVNAGAAVAAVGGGTATPTRTPTRTSTPTRTPTTGPSPTATRTAGPFTPTKWIYLPLVVKNYQPPLPYPAAPVLNPISNPGSASSFTVSWNAALNAATYLLQEDDNSGFSSPITVYNGAATSWPASGKAAGTYFYRAKAQNATGDSLWSNTQSTAVNPSGWVTLLSTDFEGSWPGPWVVDDNDGSYNGEYLWGKRDCRPFAGSYSGWGVGAGAQGASLGCGANYPNRASSWMVYGPFSLTNTTAANLTFKLWMNSEPIYDRVCRFASINGADFSGTCTAGNTGGWIDRVLDLSNVYQLGDLRGQSSIWIAILFYSDPSNTYSEGGYVDNTVLRKCPTGNTCPAILSEAAAEGQAVEEPMLMVRPR